MFADNICVFFQVSVRGLQAWASAGGAKRAFAPPGKWV